MISGDIIFLTQHFAFGEKMIKDGYEHKFIHSDPRNKLRYQEAMQILPIVFSMLGKPNSVIDVGGGQGAWCLALSNLGVENFLCIDHPDTCRSGCLVPKEKFHDFDLSQGMPEAKKTDWAMCLEVAEHLPLEQAEPLVEYLTKCADSVLFAAAIPGQPGQNHINCVPPSFWRKLFAKQGFQRYDCLRGRLIGKPIPYWWKQNLFVFSKKSDLELSNEMPVFHEDDIEFVSAEILEIYRKALNVYNTPLKKQLIQAVKRKIGGK